MSILFIIYNFGVVVEMVDCVVVMYGGCVVEEGDVIEIFKVLCYFYIMGLFNFIFCFSEDEYVYVFGQFKKCLEVIFGNVFNLFNLFFGCIFELCCKFVVFQCLQVVLVFEDMGGGYMVCCICWCEFEQVQGGQFYIGIGLSFEVNV